jgi:hypothetical protein
VKANDSSSRLRKVNMEEVRFSLSGRWIVGTGFDQILQGTVHHPGCTAGMGLRALWFHTADSVPPFRLFMLYLHII